MANSDFMIAFAIEHWHSGGKSDPKYIQWVVHREIFTDSFQTSAEWYQTHRCTDEEFERFYPTMPDAQIKVARLQAAQQWFCFDWRGSGFELFGSWRTDDSYVGIEPSIFPCASRFEFNDGSVSGGHDDCEWDMKAVQEYLDSGPSMLLLYN